MLNKYDKELQELEKDFLQKKKELKRKSIESKKHSISEDEKELAIFLHKNMCRSNHIDQCDWDYDNGSWEMYSRKEYLQKARDILKARNILKNVSFEKAMKILNALFSNK